MTLVQLHYVIEVAESGSINKAADNLFISQPSLSRAIRSLEDELGFKIFNRNGKGVTLTDGGTEFLSYAREVYGRYEDMLEKFGGVNVKKKFGVSTQHYSFAVRAFVNMVKHYDTSEYEFAIRETMTESVMQDVSGMRSEIGILYLSDFNRKAILKLLDQYELEFHHLINCGWYVYLCKSHPLAGEKSITFAQLADYPCLSFEQGDGSSFYLSEEILSTNFYTRVIKANDRATFLNLMVGLNGYTLCSGIVCNDLNGDNYLAIPFEQDEDNPTGVMDIGYVVRKNSNLSKMGEEYLYELKTYLDSVQA
ncbi:MAG: LysR family transcriptional regulator [Eubacterium sp.]|jgi:DNA-binding transcriptional LysR family regulator